MKKMLFQVAIAATFVASSLVSVAAHAGAIRNANLFTNVLGANDDGSTGAVGIGFGINFFGVSTNTLFVNNNGNVTFDSALSTFTPFPLNTTSRQILAPFFADVDTRGAGSDVVRYGSSVINGKNVFGVNWIDVGYFSLGTNKLNSFQLIMTERADVGVGDFDFEFNYDQIQWETGGASGGSDGLGGNSARMGWSNGNANTFELAGSAVNGALLDGGANALISNSLGTNVQGRYTFSVRNGVVVPMPVSLPGTLALVGLALLAAGAATQRKRTASV